VSWRGKGLQLVMMLSVGFFGGAYMGGLPDVVYVPREVSDVQRHVNETSRRFNFNKHNEIRAL